MSKQDNFISVVVPVRNEVDSVSTNLQTVVDQLQARYKNYEVICVDDSSHDGTFEKIKEIQKHTDCLRALRLSKEFGLDIAIFAGLEAAIGDYVVVMLALNDPANIILPAIELCQKTGNIVYGSDQRGATGRGFLFKVAHFIFHWYCKNFTEIRVPKFSTYFRVFDRGAVNALVKIREIRPAIKRYGALVSAKSVIFEYSPKSDYSRWHRESLMSRIFYGIGLLFSSSESSLKKIVYVYLLLGFALSLMRASISLWSPLAIVEAILISIGFVTAAMLFFYLMGIQEGLKNRPMYFIADQSDSSVMLLETRVNVLKGGEGVDGYFRSRS